MTIEIHQPELEALMYALKSLPPPEFRPANRQSLARLFAESPFKGMEMEFRRDPSPMRFLRSVSGFCDASPKA